MSDDLRQDALRPEKLTEFGGQPDLARELNIVLSAAQAREQLPDHVLLFGPPGLGKTTLAGIVANELNLPLLCTSGPALVKPGDIASLLTGLTRPSVVFIDEIHRMPRPVEEHLYSAMEDGVLDVTLGEGSKARIVRLPLTPFVLVGATTQSGLLTAPLRDRFGFHGRLKLYDLDALTDIVLRSAGLLQLDVTAEAAREIAQRSRGTPRIANKCLRRVRDFAQTQGHEQVDQPLASAALDAFGIDSIGLDSLGRDILTSLLTQFHGGPVGVATLAASVNEAAITLETVYEPFMMHAGLLMRTPRGRMATAAAYAHLDLPVPVAAVQSLPAGRAVPLPAPAHGGVVGAGEQGALFDDETGEVDADTA